MNSPLEKGTAMGTRATAMDVVDFAGWPGCLRLSNGQVELVATTAVGPRVIRFGFVGGQNLFKVFSETEGLTGGNEWHSFGGHRLWHAPEVVPRTYAPDNGPVEHTWDGTTLRLRSSEPENGLEKETALTMSPDAAQVTVIHRLVNRNPWAIELAAWALSVMAPGGRAIYPQEEYLPHPDCLVPARPLVLWHFTDMSDPRWTWGRRYIQLRQDPGATTKQKVGMLNTLGWAAYLLDGDIFVKSYGGDPAAVYTDMGCNTESYTDPDILEIETLSPLVRLEPGAAVEHRENWLLARAEGELAEGGKTPSDDEIDALRAAPRPPASLGLIRWPAPQGPVAARRLQRPAPTGTAGALRARPTLRPWRACRTTRAGTSGPCCRAGCIGTWSWPPVRDSGPFGSPWRSCRPGMSNRGSP